MKRFHFSAGDSNTGPIGICGSVVAETIEEALKKINAALSIHEDGIEVPLSNEPAAQGVEYLEIYPGYIGSKDIDEEYDVEDKAKAV